MDDLQFKYSIDQVLYKTGATQIGSINPAKSEFMLVTNENINRTPELFIGYDRITMVNSLKYLGMRIENTSKFQTHINLKKFGVYSTLHTQNLVGCVV